jgi:hypothetical protein
MTDFPRGGNADEARAWLEENGFHDVFVGWHADAVFKATSEDIFKELSGENGLKLWVCLQEARSSEGRTVL